MQKERERVWAVPSYEIDRPTDRPKAKARQEEAKPKKQHHQLRDLQLLLTHSANG